MERMWLLVRFVVVASGLALTLWGAGSLPGLLVAGSRGRGLLGVAALVGGLMCYRGAYAIGRGRTAPAGDGRSSPA